MTRSPPSGRATHDVTALDADRRILCPCPCCLVALPSSPSSVSALRGLHPRWVLLAVQLVGRAAVMVYTYRLCTVHSLVWSTLHTPMYCTILHMYLACPAPALPPGRPLLPPPLPDLSESRFPAPVSRSPLPCTTRYTHGRRSMQGYIHCVLRTEEGAATGNIGPSAHGRKPSSLFRSRTRT